MSDQLATTSAVAESGKHGQDTIVFNMHPVSAGRQRDDFKHSSAIFTATQTEGGNDARGSSPDVGPKGGPFGPGGHHGGGSGGGSGGHGGGHGGGSGGGGHHYHGGGYQHNLGGLQNAINKASRQKPTTPTTPSTPTPPQPSSGGNTFILIALIVAGGVAWYLWRKHHHKGEPLEAVH